jgi:hypothetical protein
MERSGPLEERTRVFGRLLVSRKPESGLVRMRTGAMGLQREGRNCASFCGHTQVNDAARLWNEDSCVCVSTMALACGIDRKTHPLITPIQVPECYVLWWFLAPQMRGGINVGVV